MVFNSSARADEAFVPFPFFQNNQYSVHLPIFCWLIPSNDILTVFAIQMHRQPMLTLPQTWTRSSQGHDLYIHRSTLAIDASCKVSLTSVYWFQRRRFLKAFYHIWTWRPSWSYDLNYNFTHWFTYPMHVSHKIWL